MTEQAAALFGDSIAANMMLLGAAWQKGLVPIRLEAIDQAIALNGVAIEGNRRAFALGRHAAAEPRRGRPGRGADTRPVSRGSTASRRRWTSGSTRRSEHLAGYQNPALAARYRALVEQCTVRPKRPAMPGVVPT